jgi:hypothetical protein
MKIIQLIVLEGDEVQGLGDDGKLYYLHHTPMSFGRTEKTWKLAEGLQSLASRVRDMLINSDAGSVKHRLDGFAKKYNLHYATEQADNNAAAVFRLKDHSGTVSVCMFPDRLIIRGSDDSEVSMLLVGAYYV